MLPRKIIDEAKRLLRLPKTRRPTQRAIARKLGISHTIVQRIARGYKRKRQDRWGRCPTCGHLVKMPCVCCAAEAEKRKSRFRFDGPHNSTGPHFPGQPRMVTAYA